MGERSSMALHWKILIGLALGIVVGGVINVTWDAYTWGALDVGDPSSYRASKDATRAEELPDDPERAIEWLGRVLDEYAPAAGVEPLSPPSNAYSGRVVDWLTRDLRGDAETAEDAGAARDWLRAEVDRVLQVLADGEEDDSDAAAEEVVQSIQPPSDGVLASDVAWLVRDLAQVREDPSGEGLVSTANAEAGFVASVPRLIANANKLVGDMFIRILRLIAIPLVLFSLIMGASSLNDLRKLSRIGGKTIVIYLCTTAVAITVGLALANIVQPGKFVPQDTRDRLAAMGENTYKDKIGETGEKTARELSPWDQILEIVPQNPFEALAEAKMLQVVFAALMIGVGLTLVPKQKAAPIVAIADGMTEVVIKLVQVLMLAAPFAVFALISRVVADMGLEVLGSLIVYSIVVIGGLIIMAFGVYPLVLKIFARSMGYTRFFKGVAPAQLVAFSSSSSAATLPVTMECAEDRLGVSEEVSSFVLPLGATVNMDGTALYQGVAAMFIAQLYGIDVSFTDQLMIILTATLASIGTAAVPSAGLIMLVIVLQQLGFDQAVMAGGIAILFGVDRILDMSRTVCNITGDSMVAVVVANSEGELLSEQEVKRRREQAAAVGIDEHPHEGGDEYGVDGGSLHRTMGPEKSSE